MSRHVTHATACGILSALVIGVFGDVLLSSHDTVLSLFGTDITLQYAYLREFGFGQLRQGNFPLWNPTIFSGISAIGGFQSALLYPVNWIYCVLPIHRAINLDIALHILLAGLTTYAWGTRRRLHPLACTLSAMLLMFCGPVFLRVVAGHLTDLATIAWIPLVLLALDGLIEQPRSRWYLLGMLAVAMQIVAGHPQYLYYTALASMLYMALHLPTSDDRVRSMGGWLALFIGGAVLAAAQLLPGLEHGAHSTRATGLPFDMASAFAFPPENALTFLAPNIFGGLAPPGYWGRTLLWESCAFFSITGLVLAVYGAATERARHWRVIAMAVLMVVLALGARTPLYRWLFEWMPGFDAFRGTAKFMLLAVLFLVQLAAVGLHRIISHPDTTSKDRSMVASVLLLSGVALASTALWIRTAGQADRPPMWWTHLINRIATSGDTFAPAELYQNSAFLSFVHLSASTQLLCAAALVCLLALVWFCLHRSRYLPYLLVMVVVLELGTFAGTHRPTFNLSNRQLPALDQLQSDAAEAHRMVMTTDTLHTYMSSSLSNLWGNDPLVGRRYAEFMFMTQNHNPDTASSELRITNPHPLFAMLRCRHVVIPGGQQLEGWTLDPLPRALVVHQWRVIPERDALFTALQDPAFDPRQEAILETAPVPAPAPPPTPGTLQLLDESTDHLTVIADVAAPALLVITDAYDSGWRAVPLTGSVQQQYVVQPANYVLRAIPLAAGHHHLRVEYAPRAFRLGRVVSVVALLGYLTLVVWWRPRRVI